MKSFTIDSVRQLARNNPCRLAVIITCDDVPEPVLTFALEALAAPTPSYPLVVRALLRGLDHRRPYVREGAILGCSGHVHADGGTILRQLAAMSETDPDEDIRDMARALLDEEVPERA